MDCLIGPIGLINRDFSAAAGVIDCPARRPITKDLLHLLGCRDGAEVTGLSPSELLQ